MKTATKTKTSERTEADAQKALIEAERVVKQCETDLKEARAEHAVTLANVMYFRYVREGEAQAQADAERQALRVEAVKQAKADRLAPLDQLIERYQNEMPKHRENNNVAGVAALGKLIEQTKQRRAALAAQA